MVILVLKMIGVKVGKGVGCCSSLVGPSGDKLPLSPLFATVLPPPSSTRLSIPDTHVGALTVPLPTD